MPAEPTWDGLWLNARLVTMRGGRYGIIERGALGVREGRICWLGPRAGLPGEPESLSREVHDASGCCITPGLIDCHTQLLFGGDTPAATFAANGLPAAQWRAGVLAVTEATSDASESEIVAASARRLGAMLRHGVTTVAIKSGYGLRPAAEARLLRVARLLGQSAPVTVRTSLLCGQVVPTDCDGRPGDYARSIVSDMLPLLCEAGLVDAVDVCFGDGTLSAEDELAVLGAGAARGLRLNLQADRFSEQGGAALAARSGCAAASHLGFASGPGVEAMAGAGTVAVLLPGDAYATKVAQRPPVELLQRMGVPIAIATDCNPVTSPAVSMPLMLNMACTLFGLTPEQALAGATCHAAAAIGLGASHGVLEEGRVADFVLWDAADPDELVRWLGMDACRAVVRAGEPVTRPS